jgi:hypothetical protein
VETKPGCISMAGAVEATAFGTTCENRGSLAMTNGFTVPDWVPKLCANAVPVFPLAEKLEPHRMHRVS